VCPLTHFYNIKWFWLEEVDGMRFKLLVSQNDDYDDDEEERKGGGDIGEREWKNEGLEARTVGNPGTRLTSGD
jgi:hypothetical protein